MLHIDSHKNNAVQAEPLRVVIWVNMPSHHLRAFFAQLIRQRVELTVCYYGDVDSDRVALGWSANDDFYDFELKISKLSLDFSRIPHWKNSIHTIPGYGSKFLRGLSRRLTAENVQWVHWSESSQPGIRWYLSYPIKRLYAYLVNRHALGALACSESAIRDFISWGINREVIGFVPYSSELPRAQEALSMGNDVPFRNRNIFLFIGQMIHRKGVDVLIDAFSKIVDENGDFGWDLVFLGSDKSNGKYQRLAEEKKISKFTRFLGARPVESVDEIIRSANVVVLPSRFDGWGAVISEAMSAGKAVIATNCCGASEHLIEGGVNGFVVKAGSSNSLKNAMKLYVLNDNLSHKHGNESLKLIQLFSAEANAKRFIAILESWR